jgi:hypothetical protein
VSAGFSIRHFCAYGIGYHHMPAGSLESYQLAHLRAPSAGRFKQASHREASRSERRFSAPPHDESWTIDRGEFPGTPNFSAAGSYQARVRFAGFPRNRLREETRRLREYADGG